MSGLEVDPSVQEPSDKGKLQWCLANLGQRLTTVALNPESRDASVVREWAASDIPESVQPRVSMLYGAARSVSERYDEQTARYFLRDSNPFAGDQPLLLVIAESEPEEAKRIVDGAVSSFLD